MFWRRRPKTIVLPTNVEVPDIFPLMGGLPPAEMTGPKCPCRATVCHNVACPHRVKVTN